MSEKGTGESSGNILEQIRELAHEFRKSISRDKAPKIEKFLARISKAGRDELILNLLEIEVHYRQRKGEPATIDEYLNRFPQYKQQVRRAFFEPSMDSVDSDLNKDGGTYTDSLQESSKDADAYAPTYELSDANRLGDYELIRELGRGGMGIVYEAKHTKSNNRVALKTLPTGGDGLQVNADKLHRFRREFRRLSEINHPNLVGMQSLEVDGDRWFFTMDLIDGEDFLSYVRPKDQLNEDRLRSCLTQLATGTLELHRRGIIHRDLKPSNVLVSAEGRVAILDFGLAAQLQRSADMTHSRSGMFAGTPPYAAPEQMFGERTEASDWYAFGTMLYEALAGERPFQDPDPMVLLRKKQEQDPPSLGDRDGVPDDLSSLANGLLRRESGLRLSSEAIGAVLGLEEETRSSGSTRSSQGSAGSADLEDAGLEEDQEEEIVLIGREKQLAQLQTIKQEFLASRQPQIVWITGLSGEGKSSLAEKFLQPIRRGNEMLVLSGRCYDRESVPYKAIDCILPSLVAFLRSCSQREVSDRLPEDIAFLTRLFPILRRIDAIADLASKDLTRVDSDKIQFRAFRALRQWLVSLSKDWPIVILIDDLQWADSESAGPLHQILMGDSVPTVFFIGSYRHDEANESPFLTEWEEIIDHSEACRNQTTVKVNPLSRDECVELAVLRTGCDSEMLRQRGDELLGDTGGNPYFFEQLLDGFDSTSGELRPIPLEAIIKKRLERLPAAAKQLLEMISIAGQPIEIDEVAKAVNLMEAAQATLTHMRSERLIRLLGTRNIARVDTFHDKIRETVLTRMPDKRRMSLHLQLAETIEHGENVSADDWLRELSERGTPGIYYNEISARIVDLAHHYDAAGDSRAFPFLLLAAEQAYLAYAVDEADALFERVEQSLPGRVTPSLRYRIAMARGHVFRWIRKIDQALDSFTKATQLAPTPTEEAWAFSGRAEAERQIGLYERSVDDDRRALECLGIRSARTSAGQLFSALRSHIRMSVLPHSWIIKRTKTQRDLQELVFTLGELDGQDAVETRFALSVESSSRLALAAIRSGRSDLAALGYTNAAGWCGLFGFHPVARHLLRKAKAARTASCEPEFEAMRVYWQALAAYWSGDLTNAAEGLVAGAAQNRKLHRVVAEQVCLHMNRHVLTYVGSSQDELAAARKVLSLSKEIGNPVGICWGEYDSACALARKGDVTMACQHLQQAYQLPLKSNLWMTKPIRDSSASFVLLQASSYERAHEHARFALRRVANGWVVMDCSMFSLPLWLEAATGSKWRDEAAHGKGAKDLKRGLRYAKIFHGSLRNHQPHLLRARGRANWRLGRRSRAIRCFERAVHLAGRKAMRYQQAKALLDLAVVQTERRTDRKLLAVELLKQVQSVIPRAESWLLGDQYDEEVVAPEFDLEAWEAEHGPISSVRGVEE